MAKQPQQPQTRHPSDPPAPTPASGPVPGAAGTPPAPTAQQAQDEYWAKGGNVGPQGEAREMGPEKIVPRPPRPTVPPVGPARDATGAALCDFLQDTGMTAEKLEPARAWLAAHPEATALATFGFMDAELLPPLQATTMRRAGKWLWGNEWEPASAMAQTPGEELQRLQTALRVTEEQARFKNAELIAANAQLAYLRQQLKEYRLQLDYLRAGKSPAELAGLPPLSPTYEQVG